MVLDKEYDKRKYVKNAAAPIPRLVTMDESPPPAVVDSNSTDYETYSTSAIAYSETLSSLTPQDTLSMVSTPWSTETWNTYPITEDDNLERSFLSWLSADKRSSSLTLVPASTSLTEAPATPSSLSFPPATTSSYGMSTPYNSSSRKTLTLLNSVSTSSESNQILPSKVTRKSEHSDTYSSWTMETFTSTGVLSDANILRVKYPWSPCSTVMSGSELYPSTIESYESRKVSRVSVSGTPAERDSMTPMNYTFQGRQDKDPIVDWLQVKLKGLGVMGVRA